MNIAILGDSWAHGEWSVIGNSSIVTHSGVAQYLQETYPKSNIVNFAKSGGGNIYQTDWIAEYIGTDNFRKYFDLVIVFWTDPGRDVLNEYEKNPLDDYGFLNANHYTELCNKTADDYLAQLNSLNLPVLLIGGQVSLPESSLKLENINFLVERMANLVEEPYWDMLEMKSYKGKLSNKIDWEALERIQDVKLDEQFKVELKQLQKLQDYDLNYEFFPDMGHGGRYLHKICTFKIIEYINANNLSQ